MTPAVHVDQGAFGPDADGNHEGTTILFRPDVPGDDALPALASAMEQAREGFADVVGFWGPVPYPGGGAVFSIEYWDADDDLSLLLAALVSSLGAGGVAGTLQSFTNSAPAYETSPRETFHGLTIVIDPLLRPDAQERAQQRGRFRLDDVEPSVLAACMQRALTWCRVSDGVNYLQFAAASYQVAEAERLDLVRRSFAVGENAVVTAERWPEARRTIAFDRSGRVILQVGQRDAVVDLIHHSQVAEDALRAFADVADYGCVLRTRGRVSDLLGALQHNWPPLPMGPSGLQAVRGIESDRIPDVFAMQLLGPGHDLPEAVSREWHVLDLPGGRHIVAARHPERWLGQDGPDRSVLDAARTDFASLLLTRSDEEEQRARVSGK